MNWSNMVVYCGLRIQLLVKDRHLSSVLTCSFLVSITTSLWPFGVQHLLALALN